MNTPPSELPAKGFPPPSALVAVLLLFIISCIPFAQTIGFDFVGLDDPVYITDNWRLREGLTWHSLQWAFTTQYIGLYHPVAWVGHLIDASLWDFNAGGHHASSVFWHLLASILLFLFMRNATGAGWPSLLVAMLFAAHPTRAESVAWVSERKDVLCALFWMLTLFAWTQWHQQRRAWWYILSLLSFGFALLAKPMAVSMPLILAACWIWPLRAPFAWRKNLLILLPFAILTLLVVAITLFPPFITGIPPEYGGLQIALTDRLQTALAAYGIYLSQIVWPVNFSFFHPYALPRLPWLGVSLLLLLLWIWLAWSTRRSQPWWLFALVWYVASLAPVSGIVPIGYYAYADRYAYLPLTGPFIALVWSAAQQSWMRQHARLLLLIMALPLLAMSYWQVSHWRNTETLTARALQIYPRSTVIKMFRVEWFVDNGRADDALKLATELPYQHLNFVQRAQFFLKIGEAFSQLGDEARARHWWLLATKTNRHQWPAYWRLGQQAMRQGDHLGAATHLAAALRIQRNDHELWLDYCRATALLGEVALARGACRNAQAIRPDLLEAKILLQQLTVLPPS